MRAKFHTMYSLNVVLKIVQARQKITKMLAFGIVAHEFCVTTFMPKINIFDVVYYVRNTLELSHPSCRSKSLIPYTVDVLRIA